MTNNKLTDERITELYGELFDELEVHQRATGEEGYFAVQCEEVMSALRELQEYRKAKCQHKWEVKDWHQTHSIEVCIHCGELRTGRGNY